MSAPLSTCPSDGILLRHLDGELPDDAAHAVEAHLAGCAACRQALASLGERDRAVSAWIGHHDPPPPGRDAYDFEASPRRPGRRGGKGAPRWMAAAVVVLALAGLVGPARGTILDPLVRWLDRAVGGPPPAPRAPAADGAGPAASPATSFVFEGSELVLDFAHPETRGTLTVEPGPDSLVTFRSSHRDVSLSVRPGVVEVGNEAVAAGDYAVVVPASLERLRVRVRNGGDAVVDVTGLTAPRPTPLPPPSPSRGSSR